MAKTHKRRLIVGYWDCKYCDKIGISGELRDCPSCGTARDENTTFYMNPHKIQYVPRSKADKINRNPDWICVYCNRLNSDNDSNCASCGSARSEQNHTYRNFNHVPLTSDFSVPSSPSNTSDSTTSTPSVSNSSDSTISDSPDFLVKSPSINSSNFFHNFKQVSQKCIVPFIIVCLVAALIAGCIWLFSPRYYDVTVKGFSWSRNIYIEKWQTVNESGWHLPAGGRLHYTRQEFSHYEQVFDHYETRTRSVPRTRIVGYEEYVTGYRDLGNGYFEEVTSSRPITETYYETETYQEAIYRDEPVYRTKYYYEIDKWLYERTVTTQASDHSPYWGEPNLNTIERVSGRNESYTVTVYVSNTEKEETYSFSYDDWNSLNLGDKITIKVVLGTAEIVYED